MKISVIAFSPTGAHLSDRLKTGLSKSHEVETFVKSIHSENSIKENLKEWTGSRFQDSEAIIFIGSCGIALRAVAPFVRSKKTDPAVIVADELGLYSISLLSGHLGGANELAGKVAEITGGIPVITTATDIHGKLAPDVFARRNNMVITDFEKAKKYASLQIQNREKEMELRISPFIEEAYERENCLQLIPKWAYIGIGCRKGTDKDVIGNVFDKALRACGEEGLYEESISCCASITLKEDEKGLIDFCGERNLDIRFFTQDELKKVPGEYAESEFVKNIAGVGNVCERSAMAAALGDFSGGKREKQCYFALRKFAENGVTIAIVIGEEEIIYE